MGGSGGAAGKGGLGGSGGMGGTAGGGPPVPAVCGDGFRDPKLEECDDGDAKNASDACTDACIVRDLLACADCDPGALGDGVQRFADGRHSVAAGPDGAAIAYVEKRASGVSLGLSMFGAKGKPGVTIPKLYASPSTNETAAPSVAALPGGSYVVVWSDLDADPDGLGVLGCLVSPTGALGKVTYLNGATSYGQHDPDVVWTGKEIALAYWDDSTSKSRVHVRTFSATLEPGTDQIVESTPEGAVRPSLAAVANTWAVAYVTSEKGAPHVEMRYAGKTWRTASYPPSDAGTPSLTALEGGRVLLAHAVGTSQATSIRLVVFDLAGGPMPVAEAVVEAEGGASAPAVAVAGGVAYLGFQTGLVKGGDQGDVWLAPVSLPDGALVVGAPIKIPREPSHSNGPQRRPVLAGMPLAFDGALMVGWTDDGLNLPQAAKRDVVVELIPTPVVRLTTTGQ